MGSCTECQSLGRPKRLFYFCLWWGACICMYEVSYWQVLYDMPMLLYVLSTSAPLCQYSVYLVVAVGVLLKFVCMSDTCPFTHKGNSPLRAIHWYYWLWYTTTKSIPVNTRPHHTKQTMPYSMHTIPYIHTGTRPNSTIHPEYFEHMESRDQGK